MSQIMEGDMKELNQIAERERKMLDDEMVGRHIAKCKCGTFYSYGFECNFRDPGSCPECGGRLGDIVR